MKRCLTPSAIHHETPGEHTRRGSWENGPHESPAVCAASMSSHLQPSDWGENTFSSFELIRLWYCVMSASRLRNLDLKLVPVTTGVSFFLFSFELVCMWIHSCHGTHSQFRGQL